MAVSKLTLSIEESIKEEGKRLARYHGLSLSKLVEQYIVKGLTELPPVEYIAVKPDDDILAIVADYSPSSTQPDDYERYKEEYHGIS